MAEPETKRERSKFPRLYWLVVLFEFFERGAYYGVMSVLSVYMVDELHFAKQDVGVIKSVIQPLLYFLPILAGALADRFGYRRLLLIAFSLLGTGYFLTSQFTGFAAVFMCLVVMGLGAGTFKPIIAGSIARLTDETNSTLGFGIYYWSINLGAFLVPLFLVPVLRQEVGIVWVLVAAAIGTGIQVVPTLLFFREPPKPAQADENHENQKQTSLLQTMANAFEIIFSGIVLLFFWMRRSTAGRAVVAVLLTVLVILGGWDFANPEGRTTVFAARAYPIGQGRLVVRGKPNLCSPEPFSFSVDAEKKQAVLSLYHPDRLDEYSAGVLGSLRSVDFLGGISGADRERLLSEARALLGRPEQLADFLAEVERALSRLERQATIDASQLRKLRDGAVAKTILDMEYDSGLDRPFAIRRTDGGRVAVTLRSFADYEQNKTSLGQALRADPHLGTLAEDELDSLAERASARSFILLFVALFLIVGFIAIHLAPRLRSVGVQEKLMLYAVTLGVMYAVIWLLPGISLFACILTSCLSVAILSLYAIDYTELERFGDHFRFLLMIFIYSGFWVLYFQMFDSVLWYVQAYVDASAVNDILAPILNGIYSVLGLDIHWHFDVEFVTVINACTIIVLQMIVSNLVKNTRALPTMIVGICLGTAGMALLAVSTGVWVFLAGIVIFSIGEMTAHPKVISYVGQTAPKSRSALYMGYLFLYGVIGASIGGVTGAELYVKFVEELNQPRTLWLIFAGIGVFTLIGLLLYNRFLGSGASMGGAPDGHSGPGANASPKGAGPEPAE